MAGAGQEAGQLGGRTASLWPPWPAWQGCTQHTVSGNRLIWAGMVTVPEMAQLEPSELPGKGAVHINQIKEEILEVSVQR